jgi:hypothetical protein
MRAKQHHNAVNAADHQHAKVFAANKKSVRKDSPRQRFFRGAFFVGCAFAVCAICVNAQDASGPLTPPPATEHNVHRVTTSEATEPPPPLAPAEIIKAFSAKEEQYWRQRIQYGYKKSIKVTEFGSDGKPSGEFQLVLQATVDSEGHVFEKLLDQPPSTLHSLEVTPVNLKFLARIPAYALIPGMLAKYDLRYIGTEKVDEVDCYIFEAKPKFVERATRLFQGVLWVDKQYLEVVKTYGKWVTDLGDEKGEGLPFTNFETYRENVDGKYWFPNYMRSDGYLHRKDAEDIPVRVVVKWTDFKMFPTKVLPEAAASKPSS